MTLDDYLKQLQSLLPSGAVWSREENANITYFLKAVADELVRVEGRAGSLLIEADPRTTSELLFDWERVLGLPDPCVIDAQGTSQRRLSVVTKLTTIGGQSRQYFINIAASLGYAITITEFRPYSVNDNVNVPINGREWAFVWQVNGITSTIVKFSVNDFVDDALATWGNSPIECLFSRLKPAHTTVIFNYS